MKDQESFSTESKNSISIDKLDAARRQLNTAIELWFQDKDPVSIHTLSYAAYEIIHAVSKRKNPARRDLLFDSLVIKDEYRSDFNKRIKEHPNFFKHAQNDPDATIEFFPATSELFIMFSIIGLELMGKSQSNTESAFMHWLYFHKPHLLTEKGRKDFVDRIPVDHLNAIREIPKTEFLEGVRQLRQAAGRAD